MVDMTENDPNRSAVPGEQGEEAPDTSGLASRPEYLAETGEAVGDDGSVAPIIGGLPAVEGSAWDIGAPRDERGAGLADKHASQAGQDSHRRGGHRSAAPRGRRLSPGSRYRVLYRFLYSFLMAILRNPHEVSVTEATRRGVAGLVADAEQGSDLVVTRRHHRVAAVVGIGRLAELEEVEADLRDLALVLARAVTDAGGRTSLDDVLRAFGHTRESLDALPDDE
jgi:hypothetical protein